MLLPSSTPSRGVLFATLLIAFASLLAARPAQAQQSTPAPTPVVNHRIAFESVHPDWKDCGLRRVEMAGRTFKSSPVPRTKLAKSASIVVDYGPGFTPEAREAFQRAVDIWEQHITSSVEIRVDASFQDLGEGVLGGARSNFIYGVDLDGNGTNDVVLFDALIDAVTGQNQQEGEPDIIAQFSSARSDWHYGAEPAPGGAIDFTTVVLHEIGHGLGYFDLMNYSNGTGSYGIDFNQNGTIDEEEKYAGAFDQFLAESVGITYEFITNRSVYPTPSDALGEALTSNQLFFDGENARLAADRSTGPLPPKMYAPSPFQPGSSIAHLDEAVYEAGDVNALMSPRVGAGETTRTPGPIMCGQFEDIGWTLGRFCEQYLDAVFGVEAFATSGADPGTVTVQWDVASNASIDEFIVEEKRFDEPFVEVARLDGAESPSVTLSNRPLGRYQYRIRWTEAGASEEEVTIQQPELTISISDLAVEIDAPNNRGVSTADVSWVVPASTSGFQYEVERRTTPPDFVSIGEFSTTQAQVDRLPPGEHDFRITARDGNGNVVQSDVITGEVPLSGDFVALGPYPNPARSQATIDLTVRSSDRVQVTVYDALGRRVSENDVFVQEDRAEPIRLQTDRWSPGVYFVRLTGRSFATTRRLLVIR